MRKAQYLEMLLQDNATEADEGKKLLYADIIDCADIALSQTSASFELDAGVGLAELYKLIDAEAHKSSAHCCGPFRAAELIAARLETKYVRASKRKPTVVSLADFL